MPKAKLTAGKLLTEDLARSGLTTAQGLALGMRQLTAAETTALGANFKPLTSLYIPYWDAVDPTQPQCFAPGWPAFYRVRYLGEPNGFAKLTGQKPTRYMQAGDVGLCAYFTRGTDWRTLLSDPDKPLIITEGEKKAAKACLCGLPTIGLGGVWSWRSADMSLFFIPCLERVAWARRNVYIVYDSDSRTNPDINQALRKLAEELCLRGALPHIATLPEVYEDGRKTGLDDFLAAGHSLAPVLATAEPLTTARALWGMNSSVAYIRDPGLIITRNNNARISPAAFKEHLYAAETCAERKLDAETGRVSLKRVSVAATWLRWPLRAEAARLTYLPGQARGEVSVDGATHYNVWSGWGAQPKKGGLKPFLTLLDHLFMDTPPEEKTWFTRWLAYPLQHPGTKLFTAAVMFGTRHGTGKSLVGLTMGCIYGANFSEISQADLESGFNEWAVGKQFVLGDDVTGSDRRAHADLLKKLITQKELRVNQKFVPSYTVPDCLNYYFTSNHPDAFFLEDDDRRYFVHEVTQPPLEQAYYTAYGAWLRDGGAAALFDWLLKYDLGDFNPAAPALRTVAKDMMTLDVKSDVGSWVARLLRDPATMLRVGDCIMREDLFTNRQLLTLYDPSGRTSCTANGLGRELRRAGVPQVLRGVQIRTADGPDRYYILRNAERWLKATLTEVKAHVSAGGKVVTTPRKKT